MRHTVVLKTDGTVLAWGEDKYGEATVPAGLPKVTAIAAGGFQTSVLIAEPQPPITLLASSLAVDGSLRMKLTSAPGRTYLMQTSVDLQDWTPMESLVDTDGSVIFTKPRPGGETVRFYRAVLP